MAGGNGTTISFRKASAMKGAYESDRGPGTRVRILIFKGSLVLKNTPEGRATANGFLRSLLLLLLLLLLPQL